jgi:hypothetical protein
VEFKRINGNCKVPAKYHQAKSLAQWVIRQRYCHNNNKMRPDRKELLDELDFVWKVEFLATRSSTPDVRRLAI